MYSDVPHKTTATGSTQSHLPLTHCEIVVSEIVLMVDFDDYIFQLYTKICSHASLEHYCVSNLCLISELAPLLFAFVGLHVHDCIHYSVVHPFFSSPSPSLLPSSVLPLSLAVLLPFPLPLPLPLPPSSSPMQPSVSSTKSAFLKTVIDVCASTHKSAKCLQKSATLQAENLAREVRQFLTVWSAVTYLI